MKIPFKGFGILSLVIGLVVLALNLDNFTDGGTRDSTQRSRLLVSRVGLADLILLRKNPKSLCVDLREKEFYENAHIAGAINIPLEDFSRAMEQQDRRFLSENVDLVFYSNDKNSDTILPIADDLAKRGIRQVKFFTGGWSEWNACDLPIERGIHE